MVVVALDGGCRFLEADVVESSKRRSADVFDCVIGDQELLLQGEGQQSWGQWYPTSCVMTKGDGLYGQHLTFHLIKIKSEFFRSS